MLLVTLGIISTPGVGIAPIIAPGNALIPAPSNALATAPGVKPAFGVVLSIVSTPGGNGQ